MKKVVGDVTGCKVIESVLDTYRVNKRGKYRAIMLMSEPVPLCVWATARPVHHSLEFLTLATLEGRWNDVSYWWSKGGSNPWILNYAGIILVGTA
jgi:hypothetical protein